jgi:GNAT superfamily N-acetyltransferase
VAAVRVRRADRSDIDNAAAVLADAFADYAWTRFTVDADDHTARIYGLQRLVIERLALPYGEVWVAEDAGGAIASVAIWMLPDSTIPGAVAQDAGQVQAELEGNRHDASVRAEAACAPLRSATPHYYLGAVGTQRDRQRQRFGSAVLEPVLDRARAEGATMFLETSDRSNVEFYERLGFVVTGEIVVPDGGPNVWGMTRAG